MSLSMKQMLLLAKKQPTAGVDAAPAANTNAILCRAFTPEPIVADMVARNLIRPYKGNSGKLVAGEYRRFKFEVEYAGAGAAGTEPKWGLLLEACGLSNKTVNAGTSVVYGLVSDDEPVLTLHGFLDGIKWAMLDAKGTVSFTLSSKGIPVMAYEFIGTYVAGGDVTMPTNVDYSGFQQPLTVGGVNTPTFTFHGLAAAASAYSINLANQLSYRVLMNQSGAVSPDRQPTGSVTMELVKTGTKHWDEIIRQGTTGAANLVHGTTAGNIVELQAPRVQCSPYGSPSDDQGVAMITMPFDLLPVSGNDELTVIVR